MKNYYPEKPVVPYQKTPVQMAEIIASIQGLGMSKEVSRALYVIIRFESANGRSGINNNLCGLQADSARWQPESVYNPLISGVVEKVENGTGKKRLFLSFRTPADCLAMFATEIEERGLYIGGYAGAIAKMNVSSPRDLAVAYKKEWVTGNASYVTPESFKTDVSDMYKQAIKLFP